MSPGAFVELVCLVIAAAAVVYAADQKVERRAAEEAWFEASARADSANRRLQQSANLTGCRNCAPEPAGPVTAGDLFEIHVDEALEVAEPTPTLRRVK